MQSTKRASALRLIGSALAVVGLLVAAPAANAKPKAKAFDQNPILFVHGGSGSGAQFESQKMRFMSNGYPRAWFDEVDYNTLLPRDVVQSEVDQQIDDAIAALKQRTSKSQVDVVAHSRGTSVMFDYLTDEAMGEQRRANVAHYINVDGQSQNPGVPTLAVWAGRGTPGRHMDGAENVTIPNQTHVQTMTSAESFVAYYKFLTGRRPKHDIIPQSGAIEVAGKALNFPQNTGLAGATVQVWPLNGDGTRSTAPDASIAISDGSVGGGAWGPITIQSGQRYEFALVRPGLPTLHIYYEPFVRSDYTLRLLASPAVEAYAGLRPGSMSAVNIRYKELWGDQGAENDQLRVNGLNICTETLCPISKQINAMFAFDRNRDGQTDLSSPDPVLGSLSFIQGADVFVPASSPPSDTVSWQLDSRGGGPVRTLNVPNWDSTTDGVTLQWNDFERRSAAPPRPRAPDRASAIGGSAARTITSPISASRVPNQR